MYSWKSSSPHRHTGFATTPPKCFPHRQEGFLKSPHQFGRSSDTQNLVSAATRSSVEHFYNTYWLWRLKGWFCVYFFQLKLQKFSTWNFICDGDKVDSTKLFIYLYVCHWRISSFTNYEPARQLALAHEFSVRHWQVWLSKATTGLSRFAVNLTNPL